MSLCFLEFSVGVRAFVIGFSQISSFFSYVKSSALSRFFSAPEPKAQVNIVIMRCPLSVRRR